MLFRNITGKILIFLLLIVLLSCFSVSAIKLEYKDKSLEVRKVQEMLASLGYDINIDGIYGFRTKEIVKDFQYNNNLKVDGIIGYNSYNLLKNMIEEIEYTIKNGDTLSEIAEKFNSSIKTIKKRNNLKSDFIKIGQKINIPKTGIGGGREVELYDNIIHEVQAGDALSIIAKKYGSKIETIKLANNLKNNKIIIGQNLVIPHISSSENKSFCLARGNIIWPVIGRISSYFGWRKHPISKQNEFHKGIDVAVSTGTKIRAVAAGKVIQSGWMNGYGKIIIIDHGKGIRSLYAHNSLNIVKTGQTVKLGDIIAKSGSTGRSTGPHLHFGIIINEKAINPIKYLP